MNKQERTFIVIVLSLIAILISGDIISDLRNGSTWWHTFAEALVALVAIIGIFILLRGTFYSKHTLELERARSTAFQAEAAKWREQSRKHLDGLSQSINAQMNLWKLSGSEKDIAYLLLKGLSLKEIAEIRQTSEKTVRAQCTSIYDKAGLAGRTELSAFFLEDLFSGTETQKS